MKSYINKDTASYQDEDYIAEDQIDLNKYNYLYNHHKDDEDECEPYGEVDNQETKYKYQELKYNYQDMDE